MESSITQAAVVQLYAGKLHTPPLAITCPLADLIFYKYRLS